MPHAKFHFSWLMQTLMFGIRASEPPPPLPAWQTTEKAGPDRVKVLLIARHTKGCCSNYTRHYVQGMLFLFPKLCIIYIIYYSFLVHTQWSYQHLQMYKPIFSPAKLLTSFCSEFTPLNCNTLSLDWLDSHDIGVLIYRAFEVPNSAEIIVGFHMTS